MNFWDFSRLLSATITRANLAIWVLYRIKYRSPLRKHRSGNYHPPGTLCNACLFRFFLTESCRSL
jgi:hypothetical protein